MTRSQTIPVLAAAVSLALAGCGGDGEPTTTAAPPPPPATAPEPPLPSPPPPPPAPDVTTVDIDVRDGKAVGGISRPEAQQGDKVAIVVRSDAAGAVHLHGYDRAVEIEAGKPARIVFVASIPGRFEVEMHGERHFQIADLTVRP